MADFGLVIGFLLFRTLPLNPYAFALAIFIRSTRLVGEVAFLIPLVKVELVIICRFVGTFVVTVEDVPVFGFEQEYLADSERLKMPV